MHARKSILKALYQSYEFKKLSKHMQLCKASLVNSSEN